MAEDIIHLTSSLYRFVQATEELQRTLRRLSARSLSATQVKEEFRARALQLSQRFAAARERAGEKMGKTIDDIVQNLRSFKEDLGERKPRLERFRARWEELGENYESLVAQIRKKRLRIPEGVRLEHLKPRNITRNIFHVSMGLTGVTCYELWLDHTGALIVVGSFVAFLVTLELMRRLSEQLNERLVKQVFAKISRPHESHQVPAATWYAIAVFIGVVIFPQHAIELGLLILAVGDPIASFAGKTWGRSKLWREKSLAGALGFFVAATLVGFAFLVLVVGTAAQTALGVALALGLVGSVTELFSHRLDDNFTIPLAVGAIATLLL